MNTSEEIKGFFKEADMDGSGTLNWQEFQTHMQNPAVKAYFSGLDIDPEEAEPVGLHHSICYRAIHFY